MTDTARVVIVEDSPTQALRLEHILREGDLDVISLNSAEEALERISTEVPDLVVVDYRLPGMRGDELARHMRMNLRTRSIPVMMLTDDSTRETERLGLESGADDYVSKSADEGIILMRATSLLRRNRLSRNLGERELQNLRRAHVLVVDDSPTYLEQLRLYLEEDGYLVETAKDGEEALCQAAAHVFDCVVVDLVMPGLDGIEVCERLDADRIRQDVPFGILMLTGRESPDDMMRGFAAGADDFVGKSSDITIIKARVRALLRRKFLHEENERIEGEFRTKEVELTRVKAEREAMAERAALAAELQETNDKLHGAYEELKRTHSQLVQSAKMASLGELVSGIAHEINNPLAFIMANRDTVAEALEKAVAVIPEEAREGAEKHFEKARTRLASMKDGSERIRVLVQKLRTFSRLDEGEFKLADVHEDMESVVMVLEHRLRQAEIALERSYCDDGTLYCAPGILNQVYMNLIGNAIDAIEDAEQGGDRRICLTTAKMDGAFVLEVADTGPGIEEGAHDRLFEPFFTTKEVGKGTGLGLSISYGIVQSHDGKLEALTNPEGGALFRMSIPLDLEHRRATWKRTNTPS